MKNYLSNKIATIKLPEYKIFISRINGRQIAVLNDDNNFYSNPNKVLIECGMFEELQTSTGSDINSLKTINMSINCSSCCNLACSYCFKKERPESEVALEDATKFIDMIINKFPSAEKFVVDLSGYGEPLLRLDFVIDINRYCKQKSDNINKEVLVMLVTNGTLLTPNISELLQKNGILFGVSIDGGELQHNANRKDKSGSGTYQTVISNISAIKNRDYVGAAMTITNETNDLVQNLKDLIKYFPTISMKPVRGMDLDISTLIDKYSSLFEFLLGSTSSGEYQYTLSLLNGDDYFGKFLLRSILDIPIIARCDAGIGRFSLAPNGDIFTCAAATDITELKIGNLKNGIDEEKRKQLYMQLTGREKCGDCYAKFICGGECFVVAHQASGDVNSANHNICTLKKHLFLLASVFKFHLFLYKPEILLSLRSKCVEILDRKTKDADLEETLLALDNALSFTELKKLKDENPAEYLQLKSLLENQ